MKKALFVPNLNTTAKEVKSCVRYVKMTIQAMWACTVSVLPALFDGVSPQQRVYNWVNSLLKVFNQDRFSCHHSLLYYIHIAEERNKKIQVFIQVAMQ